MKRKCIFVMMAAVLALAGCGSGASKESSSAVSEAGSAVSEAGSAVESSQLPEESRESEAVEPETSEEVPSDAKVKEASDTQEVQEPEESSGEKQEQGGEDAYAEVNQKAEESYALIRQYGNDGEYSLLSYDLKGSTLQDCGDYFAIDAVFSKPVEVPGDLELGDTYTFVADELTQESVTVEYVSEGILLDHESNMEYYYWPEDGEGSVVLYCGSDDRVDAPFAEGTLRIRKNATTGIAITGEYETVSEAKLSEDDWYNGVKFDSEGYVTDLVHFGD